jgi:enoyl-CoA hydratase/carnithine racemase
MTRVSNGGNLGRVDLRVDDDVATVLLNRPEKLNALTPEMLDDLDRVLTQIDADPAVRAVVVISAGDRAFCVGADINRFKVLDGATMWWHWTRRGHQVFDRLASLRQPTVVAIDGHAFGGGLELVLACDLRVVAHEAQLGLTEVGLGTVPGWGGTQRLPAQVGATRAKQLILTGTPIDAETALTWGLVNQAVTKDKVLETAYVLAAAMAGRAPMAVQMAKQAIDISQGANPGAALEGIAAAASAGVADFTEGLAAFGERRTPEFGGLTYLTDDTQERH